MQVVHVRGRRRNFACCPSSELVCHTEVAAWKTFIQGLGRVDRRTHHPDHIQLTNTSSKIVAANHLYLAMPGGFLVTIVEWLPPRCTLGDLLLMKGVSAPHSCWPVISMPGNGLARRGQCTSCKYVYLWPVTSVHLCPLQSLHSLWGFFIHKLSLEIADRGRCLQVCTREVYICEVRGDLKNSHADSQHLSSWQKLLPPYSRQSVTTHVHIYIMKCSRLSFLSYCDRRNIIFSFAI